MTSPEKQPIPIAPEQQPKETSSINTEEINEEARRKPAEPELDIEEAKKYLEEAYGPEKSTITADMSTPVPEKPIEPEPAEKKPAGIEAVSNFDELDKFLDEKGVITGKKGTEYKAEDLKKFIVDIREFFAKAEDKEQKKMIESLKNPKSKLLDHITNGSKLKDTVKDLLLKELERPSEKKPTPPEKTVEQPVAPEILKTSSINTEDIKRVEAKEKPVETFSTDTVEIIEKVKNEEAEKKAQAESAKIEFIDLVKEINKAEENKDKETKDSLYDKSKEVFEKAEGESLEKIVKEKAKEDAEKDGLKIVTPEEYRKEKTVETQKRIRQKERSAIIQERWDMLSVQEKERYFDKEDDKNDSTTIKSARGKFAKELVKKIDAKKEELAKGKKGISISGDVFFELMKKGLKSEDIKKIGWSINWFRKAKIEIPPLDKTDGRGPLRMTKEHLKEYLAKMEIKVKKNIEDSAGEEIERKIIEGQRRWRKKKQRHTEEIIQGTAKKYEAEKPAEITPAPKEKIEKTKIEIVSNIGEKRTPAQIKEMEKIRKQVEISIKKKKASEKRIKDLIKKQKRGGLLTAKEVAYLRAVELSQKAEKESEK